MRIIINIILALIATFTLVSSQPDEATQNGLFASDIFTKIAYSQSIQENIIFSPVSIQTALAMVFLGAEGQTASELQTGLRLSSSNKDVAGQYFKNLLTQIPGDAELNIANRFYGNIGYTINATYNERAEKYFNSQLQTIDFSQNTQAANTINSWIENKTNDKIQNVINPESLDVNTTGVIVNAIYFKGKWQSSFNKYATTKRTFYINETKSAETPFMYSKNFFLYTELPELDATAIELPYNASNVSMLLILPNSRDGLAKLECQLQNVALNTLSSNMTYHKVELYLPSFKFEFSIELIPALEELGIQTLFTNSADLNGIFEAGPRMKVSDVTHKAYIEVNEAGSEAGAATVVQIVSLTMPIVEEIVVFRADHPFLFAIQSSEAVYFAGRVASF